MYSQKKNKENTPPPQKKNKHKIKTKQKALSAMCDPLVLSFRTRESKIVSLSPVSFFEHKL